MKQKRNTSEMDDIEFLAFMERVILREKIFTAGSAFVIISTFAFIVGLSQIASATGAALGVVLLAGSAGLYFTEPTFIPSVLDPNNVEHIEDDKEE